MKKRNYPDVIGVGIAILVLGRFVLPANGAVISGGDEGHTTAPSDDPGWSYTGRVESGTGSSKGTGVYVGNGWVLTAYHVAENQSNLTFTVEGDQSYSIRSGSENTYRLRNVADTADIDMYMFRVAVPSGSGLYSLSDLEVASSLPNNGTTGTHIGTGVGQTSSEETTWYVDTDPATWVWDTEEFEGWDTNHYGYYWDTNASRDTRWNQQEMAVNNYDFSGMEGFLTSFEDTDGYGIAADKDSGSGIFFKSGGDWYLSGIGITVLSSYSGHPEDASVVSDPPDADFSAYADLTAYRDQIQSTRLLPEPSAAFLVLLAGAAATIRRRVKQNRRGYESAA